MWELVLKLGNERYSGSAKTNAEAIRREQCRQILGVGTEVGSNPSSKSFNSYSSSLRQ